MSLAGEEDRLPLIHAEQFLASVEWLPIKCPSRKITILSYRLVGQALNLSILRLA